MGVIVFVLFYFESAVLLFQLYADVDIDIYIIFFIFIILYIAVAEFAEAVNKFSLAVDQYQLIEFSILIDAGKKSQVIFLADSKVIGAEIRRGMNDACSIFGSHKIS